MSIAPVTFSGTKICLGGNSVELTHQIADAFPLSDKIIVLLDPDSESGKFGQFHNLIALDEAGKWLWIAELPTTESSDTYSRVSSKDPLIVDSFSSYACEIDEHTGRIKSKTFFK